jgi:hypothetical protein
VSDPPFGFIRALPVLQAFLVFHVYPYISFITIPLRALVQELDCKSALLRSENLFSDLFQFIPTFFAYPKIAYCYPYISLLVPMLVPMRLACWDISCCCCLSPSIGKVAAAAILASNSICSIAVCGSIAYLRWACAA